MLDVDAEIFSIPRAFLSFSIMDFLWGDIFIIISVVRCSLTSHNNVSE